MVVNVAAAIIVKDSRILICQRAKESKCPFLWEFPGGKLEKNETMEECVVRECLEELGININVEGLYDKTVYKYHDREIAITFYKAGIIDGEVVLNVHNDAKWVEPGDLKNYVFCPPDEQVVKKLEISEVQI